MSRQDSGQGFVDTRISTRFQPQPELQNESQSDNEEYKPSAGKPPRQGRVDQHESETTKQRYSKYSTYDPKAQFEDNQLGPQNKSQRMNSYGNSGQFP